MAIQVAGQDGASVWAVDSQSLAGRVSMRPVPVLGWYSVAWNTGILSAVAASGLLFSLRNTAPANVVIIRRVGIGWLQTTAFTTAQRMEFQLLVARSFTTADSGQPVTLTANQGKHRTTFPSSTVDMRCATTTVLGSSGNKILDNVAVGIQWVWANALGVGIPNSPNNLFSHDAGDHPLILGPNEGINILNGVLMGAGGAGMMYVSIEYAEATSY
jgi:hypothetical protein